MKTIELQRDERIVAVVPEYFFGPGWSYPLVLVYIVDSSQRLRIEAIQPEDQTPKMRTLFGVGAAACGALVGAVPTRQLKEEKA
jgi:hypothetical protein